MNINRIQADIATAKNNMSSIGNPFNDEYMYDIAAYHTQQAIEKCLKYLLHNVYGEDDTARTFKTHNISTLLLKLDQYDKTFLDSHKELVEWSDEITSWEASTRYGTDLVATKNMIETVLDYAEQFISEIKEYEKEIRDISKDDSDVYPLPGE